MNTPQQDNLNDTVAGLAELASLINFRVGAWQDFGYEQPPAPDCAAIPPLGDRSAKAIEAGHEAVRDIDQLIAQLHRARDQLVSELRANEDALNARVDAMLAEHASPTPGHGPARPPHPDTDG